MASIKTDTGSIFHTDKPARCRLITYIDGAGRKAISPISILGISGYHYEGSEKVADILVMDQFGDTHEVPEDLILQ